MQPTQTLPNSPWLIGISRQRCRLLRLVDSGFYIAYIYIYLFICLFIYLYIYLFNRYRNIFTYPVYDHDISTHIHMSMAPNTGDHGQPRGFVLIIVGKIHPDYSLGDLPASHITDYQGITILKIKQMVISSFCFQDCVPPETWKLCWKQHLFHIQKNICHPLEELLLLSPCPRLFDRSTENIPIRSH